MEGLLSINPGLVFWTIVSFVLLVAVLGKFAWGPILKALEEREHKIAHAVRGAEEAREKAAALLAEQKALLVKAEAEADAVRDAARREAEARAAEMYAEAHKRAEGLLERARREIAGEQAQAIQSLRKEAAEIAIRAASRLLERNVNTEDNQRLVERFVSEVERREDVK